MAVRVTRGFMLECVDCGNEVMVGPTAKMHGQDPKLTWYFLPGTVTPSWDSCVGMSEGTGDSFKCWLCYWTAWQPPEDGRAL